ncbi:MAG: hypothetical protein COU07_03995 [Candidatus Harrisonbacteria bacterium CG10_big_fil_rev_8_21_14_0_10_40_38]|uniref:RNA polymerase subunit sigma-70 n=1 Tax=Candidatus Harrisonbacteria bacterium CG10_big_fil_rev_8_21_14_0_10_40_38 TaxID=1974583 RepID=A0A2H0URP4_9BACT|nr:MAG: hypothetical protein COU07_03995 [Candidatus Harrisonbacteria bacterium CG10_big_fil_rev_8_21_14_0_10_40_38]
MKIVYDDNIGITVTKDLAIRFIMLEREKNLIQEAKSGESKAFEALYNHYITPIYRFIYMRVSQTQEAEDLTHEVFVSAWQSIGTYTDKGFPFSSWLYQIARNKVIDHYRTKKNHTSVDEIEGDFLKSDSNIELDLENILSIEKVKSLIQKLTPDQQDVILMRFMNDQSHKDIAKVMKKSEGAVRLMQHRAINTLKKLSSKKPKTKSIFPNIQEML